MSDPTTRCPVCDASDVVELVRRDRLPVMQNLVWPTRDEALAAPCAPFTLAACRACGFAFNARFDPALMVYDPRYDNDVPSAVFTGYYRSIARQLADRHPLTAGPVYDVGCGKGTFLDVLCGEVEGARGVGVDPSCTPRGGDGPVTLVRDVFRAGLVTERPALVVCRHVVEHIARPVDFVRAVVDALRGDAGVPLYFEVPELEWILRSGAFWDFCYEHCNYFTPATFAHALALGGVEVSAAAASFGDQYQWAEGRVAASPVRPTSPAGVADFVDRLTRYAADERRRVEGARERLREAGARGPCVLWGMATKGVVFANLVDPDGSLLRGGVDVNAKKQGRFIPGSGHGIHAPEWLTTLEGEVTVFVMNGNYAAEIEARCAALGVRARFELP